MATAVPMVDVWRGDLVESQHLGHAVICDGTGQIVEAWGDPGAIVYPRSSAKMVQALPLIESGAARAFGLSGAQLALACASHTGMRLHTDAVQSWLAHLGLSDADFRCGTQAPLHDPTHHDLIRQGQSFCQYHNTCSGKHAGFLTLSKHLGAGPEYIDPDHPVQKAGLAALEDITNEVSAGFGIDGCSAPNYSVSLQGMARAMAAFATAREDGGLRQQAMRQLWQAMITHPENVAGDGKACTELMRACNEPAALKYGAEGFYVGILPDRGLGIALKTADGASRAAECAMAGILVLLGVLDATHPAAKQFMTPSVFSKKGLLAGRITPAPGFAGH